MGRIGSVPMLIPMFIPMFFYMRNPEGVDCYGVVMLK